MKRYAAGLAALALPATLAAREMPEHAYAVEPAQIESLFRQCSRYAPDFVPTEYQLRVADIITLEGALPDALYRHVGNEGYGTSRRPVFEPAQYVRHYAAYDAGGRAMIYGSFAPLIAASNDPELLLMVCDGGPSFFGVEYDVERKEITRISFNGRT